MSRVTLKNPPPLMAMSRVLLVVVMLPWVYCWKTDDSDVPMPTCDAPLPLRDAAYTSAKWPLDDLKPTVLLLATLLPTTSSALEDAFSPLKPC